MIDRIRDYPSKELGKEIEIDYFATSLPMLLVFNDDLQKDHECRAKFLLAQAAAETGHFSLKKNYLYEVLSL